MKTPANFAKFWLPIIALSMVSVACNDDSTNVNEISEADLEYAAAVVGASLSDETDGFMASAYDATANVGSDGLSYGSGLAKRGDEHQTDRGAMRNASYSYDPATGTHSISVERSMSNARITKSLSIAMKHIFTHESGAFVVQPRVNKDSVNSIYFTSSKSGSEESAHRDGEFTRIDTLSMSGLSSAATTLVMNGSHYGNGAMTVTTRKGATLNRYHDVFIKLTDVTIDKETVRANENLEEGVTGTIDYKMVSYNSAKDDEEVVVEGSITMTGDGTALMNFKGFAKRAIINLQNGEFSINNN